MSVLHVAKNGNNHNDGSAQSPFLTINHAAQVACAGDTVVVHAGVYREAVRPRFGGKHPTCRITYQAAANEQVVIKGSEQITTWTKHLDGANGTTVFKTVIPNSVFGDFNPYATKIFGDWLMEPYPCNLHLGDVYLDGKSLYEAASVDELVAPKMRQDGPCSPWCVESTEKIPHPEDTTKQWYAEVDDNNTTIYANFGAINPAEHCIEVNVREYCFAPAQVNTNYITIEGFEMCHAACQWAPPTGVQRGMIDTYWSKGWIIRNCHLHDAKNSAISMGKEISTGDCEHMRFKFKPGYQMQLEAVFKALKRGWSSELIGSHEVYDNCIHDCGQNAVVGHLGCINSHIHHNHIYNIAMKHEYFGHEIAGIKLHAAIDVIIDHNEFHDCTLGIWLDWEAQGTRISSNAFYDNYRDLMIEVTHGPCLVDNNVFGSQYNFDNVAQGTALVNNLFAGTTRTIQVLNRATPYHAPHSTDVTGYAFVYSGDDRVYNNIFLGGVSFKDPIHQCGTAFYDGHCASFEEYHAKAVATGSDDLEGFEKIPEAVYIEHNAYLKGAKAFAQEQDRYMSDADPAFKIYRDSNGLQMELTVDEQLAAFTHKALDTQALGATRLTEGYYEQPDGSPITLDCDLTGNKTAVRQVGPVALSAGTNKITLWK